MNEIPSIQTRQRGMTLLEVLVSLWILAFAAVGLLTSLGGASDAALVTTQKRQMRYLAQLVMADVEIGKLSPEMEEPYEEGTREAFEGWGSTEGGDEYANFEYVIEALRDELLAPGAADEEAMMNAGFEPTESGGWSRPVSNDSFFGGGGGGLSGSMGGGGEEAAAEGPMKRLAVVAIRLIAEDPEEEMSLRIVTYLPHPDEETPVAGGGEGEGGGGAGGAQPGGAAATSTRSTGSTQDR